MNICILKKYTLSNKSQLRLKTVPDCSATVGNSWKLFRLGALLEYPKLSKIDPKLLFMNKKMRAIEQNQVTPFQN